MVGKMVWFPQPHIGKFAPIIGEYVVPPPRHLPTLPLHAPYSAACSPIPSSGNEVVCHVEQDLIHQRRHQVLLTFVTWASQKRIQVPHQDNL